jgi:hypothetical protein
MSADRPRISAELLSVKGKANATPDVMPSTERGGADDRAGTGDLAALANERKPAVTFTFRMDAERHKRLRDLAHDNHTSIQAILDYALKQMGL